MKINVLLFALYRDLAGIAELTIELPAGADAAMAVAALRERGESFQKLPDRPVVAVNREYAELDAPLSDGDELALLPPVAGG